MREGIHIPNILIEQIKKGEVVLFLGAGASFDSLHPEKKEIPSAKGLANLIACDYLKDESLKDYDLSYISEIAISETDLFRFQTFIKGVFEDFKPNDFHSNIALYSWKSIFTTNYDLIVERAYENSNSHQDLASVYKNTPVQNIFKTEYTLPYYKLHGCITNINDEKTPLILTIEQYISHLENRDRLFKKLYELASDFPILFVGYGYQDHNIRHLLSDIKKNIKVSPRNYYIKPINNDVEKRLLETKHNLTVINSTFSDFINELKNKIDNNTLNLSKALTEEELPIYSHFITSKPTKDNKQFLNFINNEIEFVHRNISIENSMPKDFFKGYIQGWEPIIKNWAIERDITDSIILESIIDNDVSTSDEQFLFVINGNAGSGKSVLLRKIAWEASISFNKLCIWYKKGVFIKPELLFELYEYTKERIYIYIENCVSYSIELEEILNKAQKKKIPITIIATERTNSWAAYNGNLLNYLYKDYLLGYLKPKEVDSLISKLEMYNCLGYLEKKNKTERLKELEYKSGRELLVALYESTLGKPFEEIIYDEYNKINNDRAKSVYITISLLHLLGSHARAGLISRIHGITFSEFKEKFFIPLKSIIFTHRNYRINDDVYTTRHKTIAEIVFNRVIQDEDERFDEYIRVLSCLDIDYESDRHAFISMTKASNLKTLFSNKSKIRKIYEKAKENVSNNAKLIQQEAIFEMKEGDIDKSEKLLENAKKIDAKDNSLNHSLAEILYNRAIKTVNIIEKKYYLDECIKKCKDILNNKSSYPYHTLSKSYLEQIKILLEEDEVDPPTYERLINNFEKYLNIAKALFPDEDFIKEIESKFKELLDDKPKAISILKEAFKNNPNSKYLTLRLANLYLKENDLNSAKNTLEKSLSENPNDKDVNSLYSYVYSELNPEDFTNIKYYCRKSFLKGDSNFYEQFWYARACFLNGDIDEAKSYFDKLKKVKTNPSIKAKLRGIVKNKNHETIRFQGTISAFFRADNYGYIKSDNFKQDIYFKSTTPFGVNDRVSFELNFNYYGNIGTNLKKSNY
ncbi:SIR2 family protein [Kordia sp.]|uniref:P-loop NTPase n=1 Tax=Kordia sp. TaxID=1965332 RepID=UPI003B5C54E7